MDRQRAERAAHHLQCGWLARQEVDGDTEAATINRRLLGYIGSEDDWSVPSTMHWLAPEDRMPHEDFYGQGVR